MIQNQRALRVRTFLSNFALFTLAYYGAFALTSDWFRAANSSATFEVFKASVFWILAIKFAVFYALRPYRNRNMGAEATTRELRSIVVESFVAFGVAIFGFATASALNWIDYRAPSSVLAVDLTLTIVFRGAWRSTRRFHVAPGRKPAFLSGIREVEVDDLLKREPIRLDMERIKRQITGRRVMVTGAGGSIGSEICRRLASCEPAELILLGRGENRIFFLERELRALGASPKLTPIIADVSNKERIDGIFDATKPEIVFHTAAHKHIALMEANVPEAIRNNIYGTKVVADASDRCGAEKFVMVSTDKAVNPTNVMGCSKQMAERYVNALAERSKTKFIVTRFGNVLGSNGSVAPIFTEQIRRGGPITVTDFRMTRYFMTISEAAQLVLEAGAMGKGGEIFVLDMGEPVKIETLARDLIRLSGLPENAIEIREIGLRPGEKLYEELYFETETRIETEQKKIFAANHRQFNLDEIQAQLDELLSMLDAPQDKIRERLAEFVPEYKPAVWEDKK